MTTTGVMSSLVIASETGSNTLAIEIGFTQGVAGPRGYWAVDRAFKLREITLPILDGRISLDLAEANTFFVLLTEDVTEIDYINLPEPGVTIRVQLYIQQDEVGGRVVTGWPLSTQTAAGLGLLLSPEPGALDSIVLDTFDGGETVQLNLVGLNYRHLNR